MAVIPTGVLDHDCDPIIDLCIGRIGCTLAIRLILDPMRPLRTPENIELAIANSDYKAAPVPIRELDEPLIGTKIGDVVNVKFHFALPIACRVWR